MQRPEQPIAAAVSGEHWPGTVGAVGGRCKPDDQMKRIRITKRGHRLAPIILVQVGSLFLLGNLLPPCNESRTEAASDHLLVVKIQPVGQRFHRFFGGSLKMNSAMPVYEYEPDDRDCFMCEGRVQALQGIHEEPLKHCPWCGLDVRRVISNVTIKLPGVIHNEKKGFTTWKRTETGVWEKIDGPGANILMASEAQKKELREGKKKPKIIDLDAE
jgi:putative FmdB family regulatory protein